MGLSRSVRTLAREDDLGLSRIAEEWAATEEWAFERASASDLEPFLHDLSGIAKETDETRRLFVWMFT